MPSGENYEVYGGGASGAAASDAYQTNNANPYAYGYAPTYSTNPYSYTQTGVGGAGYNPYLNEQMAQTAQDAAYNQWLAQNTHFTNSFSPNSGYNSVFGYNPYMGGSDPYGIMQAAYGGGGGYGRSGAYSPWDPQGTAYNIGTGGHLPPYLSAYDLNRVANYANAYGGYGNPQAGNALASVGGAEGQGGNPWAYNTGSGAQGMFQWLYPSRVADAQWALGPNAGPESQAQQAMFEIGSGGYPRSYAALNNPNSSMQQMQQALISEFENPNPPGVGAWNYGAGTPAAGDYGRAQQSIGVMQMPYGIGGESTAGNPYFAPGYGR